MNDHWLHIAQNCTIDTFNLHMERAIKKTGEPYIDPEQYCYAWISLHYKPDLWKCQDLRQHLGWFTLCSGFSQAVKHF